MPTHTKKEEYSSFFAYRHHRIEAFTKHKIVSTLHNPAS